MKTCYNPDEADRFAKWLLEETGQVMLDYRDTEKILTGLQNRWKDAKYDGYLRTFDESFESLARFRQHAEQYAAYLREKSKILRDYFGSR